MHKYLKLAMGSLVPVMLLSGCSDWLTGPKLTNNPNAPAVTGRDQLFVGVTTTQTVQQTGDLARLYSMWVQSMAGTDRQYVGYANYVITQDNFAGDWSNVYLGGGLINERAIEAQALSVGDSTYAGIAKVLEALTMGTAADVWGDVPYRQAVGTELQPALDPQQQVFADVQAQLDTAVAWIPCAALTCAGPGGTTDLFYQSDKASWLALAHTLKARYFMHVTPMDPTGYDSALVEAQQGIPDAAHDLVSYQSPTPTEWNLWYQFMVVQRSGYIGAGGFLVNLLNTTHDPRLAAYYSKNSAGQFIGAPPTGGNGDFSSLSATRLDPAFRQPIVKFAENELIIAEAQLHAGNQAAAIAAYNAERALEGVAAWPGGAITLNDIITEKYIADFEEIEPYNDWKRTCLPSLVAASATGIPGRVFYPSSTEGSSNHNIPPLSQQPLRNWDQPNACPTNLPG